MATLSNTLDAQAEYARARQAAQQSDLLGATEGGNRMNLLSVVAQMANNPELAKAAGMAATQRQRQFAPEKMGQEGHFLPESGQYVESPMHTANLQASRDAIAAQKDADRKAREGNLIMSLVSREGQAEEARALKMTMAQMAAGFHGAASADRATAANEKQLRANEKERSDRVNKLSTLLDRQGVPEFESALGGVEGLLAAHKPGNLPGIGPYANAVPNWAAGAIPGTTADKVQDARGTLAGAANVLLKARSGTAVSASELRRFLEEVSSGVGMEEKAMRNGWARVRAHLEDKKANIAAGVTDDVLNEYNSNSPPVALKRRTPAAAEGQPNWLPKGFKLIGPAP